MIGLGRNRKRLWPTDCGEKSAGELLGKVLLVLKNGTLEIGKKGIGPFLSLDVTT